MVLSVLVAACSAGAPGCGLRKAPATTTAATPPPPEEKAVVATSASAATAPPPEPAKPKPELPRGGREIFPKYRLVGYCGTPGAPALGRLMGNLDKRAKEIQGYAEKYTTKDREVLPVFELIAVVVQGYPGPDGKWRRRVPTSVIDDYLQAARKEKALLLLNIQPGHSDFLTELKELEGYLKEPDVGVALDPEWAMKPKQIPGKFYGQATGAVIDGVGEYLAGIISANDLPEKPLVYHQVNDHVVKEEALIKERPGVVYIKSVDGLGPMAAKINTYNYLVKNMTKPIHAGFKLFFDEDTANKGHLMHPKEVLALKPVPEYVMYE